MKRASLAAIPLAVLLPLCGCASSLATTKGISSNGNLMYAGTRLNASIITQESCKSDRPENYGCAYDKVLAPLSLIDFIPSLALDTVLLPFTAIHAALQPKAESTPTQKGTNAKP